MLNEEIYFIYLEGFRRNLKNLSHDRLCPGMASKRTLQNKNSRLEQ